MVLARRWSGDNGNTFIGRDAGETTAQYVNRLTSIAIDGFKRDPARILNTMVDHFFNNLFTNLNIFPIRDRLHSPAELWMPQHAFWQTGARSPLLSTGFAILLAIGLAAAWTLRRWVGMLPFTFSLAYHASTAFFLSSGDRFLLPIDWTWTFYFCLGLLSLSKLVLTGLYDVEWISVKPAGMEKAADLESSRWRKLVLTCGIVLSMGASLPLTEFSFPQKYPVLTQGQLSAAMGISPLEGERIVYGRAIYPRYYEAGEGEPGSAKLGYGASDEARLVFWLVGPEPGLIILPMDHAPEFFPNVSNVWILGSPGNGDLNVRVIKVEKDGQSITYRP
jgi:hypothetical protein